MHTWHLKGRVLTFERCLVMGIVNVTPDSFSDGGCFLQTEVAIAHALNLVQQGADILDVGGESTRPGSEPVDESEELRRVVPVVLALRAQTQALLSIDTSKASVARACLEAGADIINDVTGLEGDSDMAAVVRDYGAAAIVMHMQGTPATMQLSPHYDDVAAELYGYFEARLSTLAAQGVDPQRLALDPGIGFGKTVEHNLTLLARLRDFQKLGRPICLGVSRKRFLGKIAKRPVEERLAGSLALACDALAHDAVQILRVHDVAETRDAVAIFAALADARRQPN